MAAAKTDLMIQTSGLTKKFGSVTALDDVDLEVATGTVVGLLGHNGAGKTTLVNVLSTQVRPSAGTARVAGYDVVDQGAEVRRRIGLTGQFAAVDDNLSGRDNLVLLGRLFGASRSAARRRADELIEAFDLTDAAKRQTRGYSGGMRRRVDLAACLVGRPRLIFLDEPTTGLDPQSRRAVWETIEGLVADGATVLLTTQYLEEADRLASAITVLADGRVIAAGPTAELKAKVGRRTVNVTLRSVDDVATATDALRRNGFTPTGEAGSRVLTTPVTTSGELVAVVRAIDEVRVEIAELAFAEPTLDDAYLALNEKRHEHSHETTTEGTV
ncbi:ATP-binding cassette domain-containing protein [Virgisporangium ochraceum]|nr:ATP-binding cassette domain-containing protein [Virgisporangium ochraceum]